MEKKNYNKIYNEKNKKDEEAVVVSEDPKVEPAVAEEEAAPKKEKAIKLPFMGEVIGDLNLNVRKSPNGDVFTSIPDGANVKVLEISEDGNWYFIESPKGYVKAEFIKKSK